jgi:hypothetical protein
MSVSQEHVFRSVMSHDVCYKDMQLCIMKSFAPEREDVRYGYIYFIMRSYILLTPPQALVC